MNRADVELAYRHHAHSVLRRAHHVLGSLHDAREIVQEVFLSLLEQPEQFDGRSSLLTFLYAATTHRCLNRLRNHGTRARLLDAAQDELEPCALATSPERALELRRLLIRLPEELAELAVYQHLDGLSYDEAAAAMGCSRRKVAYLAARLRAYAEETQHGTV